MQVILLAALVAFQAPPAQGQRQDQSNRPGATAASSETIEGQWYLVYGEDHGQKIEGRHDQPVTIRNNMVSWTREGKQHTVRLEFGPHHTVRAIPETGSGTGGTGTSGTGTSRSGTGTSGTGTSGTGTATGRTGTGTSGSATGANNGLEGVYILSKEFLCFSMNDRNQSGTGTGTSGTGRTGTGGTGTSGTGRTGTSGTGASGGAMNRPHASAIVLILSKHPVSSATGR